MSYNVENYDKNLLIIFNHKIFDTKQEERSFSTYDVEALTTTFKKLKFDVCPFDDLKEDEIFKELEKVLKNYSESNVDYGCIAVAVLTHGTTYDLRAKNKKYSENKLIDFFSPLDNTKLYSKPKIFIIQACRGSNISKEVQVNDAEQAQGDPATAENYVELNKPSHILVLHSTYIGKCSASYSHHSEQKPGGLLIQELCSVLNSQAGIFDIESVITQVIKNVGVQTPILKDKPVKQTPVVTNTLEKQLNLVAPQSHYVANLTSSTQSKTLNFCSASCCSDYLKYISNALRLYWQKNPDDAIASYLVRLADVSIASDDVTEFEYGLIQQISRHLNRNVAACSHYEYLYVPT
ncbi:caspase-1-like [Anticarsia gemmatalis]|uniref:caspase-1-like n=1 Tax=Anticarsia gemmatalis TaxID=129554 RepID=UPI003F76DBBC